MAEKEIGLMQIRTGKQRNLPPALEHGELAFTTDECRVFVGLPSTVTPASLVAGRTKDAVPGSAEENVELLTEFTPAHVLTRALYKAVKVDVPANGDFKLSVPSADRLFLDYVAFSIDGTGRELESGSVQIVVIGGKVLLYQQNNTSRDDGVVKIEARSPTVNGALTHLVIHNDDAKNMRFEYIYRGWKEPI